MREAHESAGGRRHSFDPSVENVSSGATISGTYAPAGAVSLGEDQSAGVLLLEQYRCMIGRSFSLNPRREKYSKSTFPIRTLGRARDLASVLQSAIINRAYGEQVQDPDCATRATILRD
ncbi:hypothetical protein KM043_002584 [Ampulex compressa]|nr:hypothetical protein KM043_002584 [Ampulex compressa]